LAAEQYYYRNRTRTRINAKAEKLIGSEQRTSPEFDANTLLWAVAENRDRKAFRELYAHFSPRLNAYVLRQGTEPQIAEEVVQESMVKVWRKAGQFDPSKAAASTWIFTIARNMRIDLLRRNYRPDPDKNDPAFTPDPEPQAFDTVSLGEDSLRLRRSIEKLPVEQQKVLQLAFFEDKPHSEVAKELNMPLGTVKSRIRLALQHLRSEIGDKE
jgi:RNA polymerase sigma factor (sigma-70 family)